MTKDGNWDPYAAGVAALRIGRVMLEWRPFSVRAEGPGTSSRLFELVFSSIAVLSVFKLLLWLLGRSSPSFGCSDHSLSFETKKTIFNHFCGVKRRQKSIGSQSLDRNGHRNQERLILYDCF